MRHAPKPARVPAQNSKVTKSFLREMRPLDARNLATAIAKVII
jgi:hypothetical protein